MLVNSVDPDQTLRSVAFALFTWYAPQTVFTRKEYMFCISGTTYPYNWFK